jgi:hypothetical protein
MMSNAANLHWYPLYGVRVEVMSLRVRESFPNALLYRYVPGLNWQDIAIVPVFLGVSKM